MTSEGAQELVLVDAGRMTRSRAGRPDLDDYLELLRSGQARAAA